MDRCPVCGREKPAPQCQNCGFDSSCDYERYPTLTPLKGRPDSVSRRRESLRKQECAMLRCPNCGGGQFSVDFANQLYTCSGCGHRFSPAVKAAEEQKTEPAKKSVTQKKRDLEEKPPRHWIEKSMILLGWVYIALHLYYFIFVSGKYPQLNCFLICVALLMQLRLHRKGFAGPFINNWILILVRVVNALAQLFFIPGILFVVCLPFVCMQVILFGEQLDWGAVLISLGFLYHFLWHFILAVAMDWNFIFSPKSKMR